MNELDISSIISVVVGAVISLIGSLTASFFSFRSNMIREEKTTERHVKELEAKMELEKLTFDHNVRLNNREYMLNSGKSIVMAINQLFDCTEELVCNYPGTCYTGEYPGFIFRNTIDNLSISFPNSREEISKLSKEWYQSHKNFNNVLLENSLFLSTEIMKDVTEYEACCINIRDYFYARFSEINSDEEFNLKRSEYLKQKAKLDTFILNNGIAEPTHNVVACYKELKKRKSILINKINTYQKEKTEL
ncbi:hypothetical protein ACJQ41_002611 [Enterococcus faecalis]